MLKSESHGGENKSHPQPPRQSYWLAFPSFLNKAITEARNEVLQYKEATHLLLLGEKKAKQNKSTN